MYWFNGPKEDASSDESLAGETSRMLPRSTAVYRADAGHVGSVRALGTWLGLAIVFSLLPALLEAGVNLETAPGWARAAVLLAAIQAFFVVWMICLPDVATVWTVMLVFVAVSALYALTTALVMVAPADRPLPLALGDVRRTAGTWCAAVLAVMALCTYLTGRLGAAWFQAIRRGA
jgi:hypothetical protein